MKLRAFERSKKLSTSLLNDESGAVTIDWVVITAVIAGLGFFGVLVLERIL